MAVESVYCGISNLLIKEREKQLVYFLPIKKTSYNLKLLNKLIYYLYIYFIFISPYIYDIVINNDIKSAKTLLFIIPLLFILIQYLGYPKRNNSEKNENLTEW